MKVQEFSSYPCIPGVLSPPSAVPAKALPPSPPTNQAATAISPILRASRVHVFSPAVASASSASEKVMDGLRAFSDLITPHCGTKVAVTASAVWLAVDTASAHRTFRDPSSSRYDRVSAGGAVLSDAVTLLGGIVSAPGLDQAANVINYAAIFGDHVHTGQITLSPSELAQLSFDPQADQAANIAKLTELLQSTA